MRNGKKKQLSPFFSLYQQKRKLLQDHDGRLSALSSGMFQCHCKSGSENNGSVRGQIVLLSFGAKQSVQAENVSG